MALRLSIRGASQRPEQIGRIRRAFTRMQSVRDERGYDWFASVHGLTLPIWCTHGNALFLPWHRAYLYYFELALQTRLGPGFSLAAPQNQDSELIDVGLPWWDWASEESHLDGIPDAYTNEQIDGNPNTLASAAVGSCAGDEPFRTGIWSNSLVAMVRNDPRLAGVLSPNDPLRTRRDPDLPDELPRQATLDDLVLSQPTFNDFTISLEQVHNQVHGWVGGSMSAVLTAAYDPIFWSHHAMIDRLWYIWQNGPLGVDPPRELMDTVLAPFPMTVAQTLDITRLGYGYAVQVA